VNAAARAAAVRSVLAAVVAGDLLSFWFFVRDARGDAALHNVQVYAVLDLLSRVPAVSALVLVGGIAAWAFARRAGRLMPGFVALAVLIVLSTTHAQLYGSPWRHLFFSGICLLGWLLGLVVARRHGRPEDESYAQVGSIALLGAAYLNSGISKLVLGGLDWTTGLPIQVVVVGQDGLAADGVLSAYRSWIAMSPHLAAFFSIATVGFELSGPLMLVGRKTRAVVAAGLLAMHANIFLLTDILYWESMVMLALFGLFADVGEASEAADTAQPAPAAGGRFAIAVGILAACAALAIGYQARRAPYHGGGGGVRFAGGVQQLGPFSVGQILAQKWAVESVSLHGEGIALGMSSKEGRARFEVTCAPDQEHGPFDVGAARIGYESDLTAAQLESLGRALQAHVQQAARDGDICATLATWRNAADGAAATRNGRPLAESGG
jgi:hypothetical protein